MIRAMLLAPENPNDLLHFALMGLRALPSIPFAGPMQQAAKCTVTATPIPQSDHRPGEKEAINEGLKQNY